MGNQADASLNRRLPADTKKFTGHLAGYSTTLIAWESEIGNLDFSCQRWASEAATTDEFIAFYRKVADSRHLVAATGVEGDRCLDNLSHDLSCAQRRCKYDAGFIDGNKIHWRGEMLKNLDAMDWRDEVASKISFSSSTTATDKAPSP